MKDQPQLRGGVIGFGYAGRSLTDHVRRGYSDLDIVACCNRGEQRLQQARDEYGMKVTHDVEELLGWDLDFVCVMSTTYAHREQVLAVAEAGLPIFCEKPIALTLEDADAMVRAVESKSLLNVVNYSLRYVPGFIQLREWIRKGELGDILSIHQIRSRGSGLWGSGNRHRAMVAHEEAGSWLIHHMCHDVDLVYWFLGDFEDTYCKTTTTHPDPDAEEIIWSLSTLKNGIPAVIGDTIAKHGYGDLIVHGTGGCFRRCATPWEELVYFHREGERLPERLGWDFASAKQGVDHFVDCLRSGTPSQATLREARESLRICLAMKESARRGKVVKVPPSAR